jgi:hypothetical protein
VNTLLPSGAKATAQMTESCRKRTVPRRISAPSGSGSPVESAPGVVGVFGIGAAASDSPTRKRRNTSEGKRMV